VPDAQQQRFDRLFRSSALPHILQITNHGLHQWQVIPGLPDTGGQNVFVNQFTGALADAGFRVTIANRGGYPHPVSAEPRRGLSYRDGTRRLLYLEDDEPGFVRKEAMDPHTPVLARFLHDFLAREGTQVDLVISHYWDGAKVGVLLERMLETTVPHVWVPHSLGTVKKRNVAPEKWAELRIDERIEIERRLVPELDGIAATSSLIRTSLRDDYGHESRLFLPPCIDTVRFRPHRVANDDPLWSLLSSASGLEQTDVRRRRLVTEISRTDTTKRKDVLIRAFAQARVAHPDTLLVVAIDKTEARLAAELRELITTLGLPPDVAVVGNVWDHLPALHAATYVYCSPSIMEGFGMAVEEAAASSVPVIGSDRIPFVVEHLLGTAMEGGQAAAGGPSGLRVGAGAVVVPADDVAGFAQALELLLADRELRDEMGRRAYEITVPDFTWPTIVDKLLEDIGWRRP